MAKPTTRLIRALRNTASRLESGAFYRWTHLGACNCGHLAQTLTELSAADIRTRALEKSGEWSDQAVDYCPTSGLVIDDIISTMLKAGMSLHEFGELERLSSPSVLRRIPFERRPLDHRRREDVVLYLRTWADLLAEKRIEQHQLDLLTVPLPRRSGPSSSNELT